MSNLGAGAKTAISFELGRVCATPGALRAIESAGQTPGDFLQRHLSGDWGELDAHDSRLNDAAVRSGEKLWVITEWDRSARTLLLPEDY
jgi:hypothetical protein